MRGFRTGTSGRHSLRRLDVIVNTEGLAKRYGQTDALVDLTMRVEPGEVFGFLGPNGAGKTTAVKLLLGLARPTGGHGTVLDAPLGDRAARARIGYLPELFRYQPWLRAREVLELHARLIGSGVGRSTRAIDDILVDVGLLDRATDLVGGFSKGMQQRLGLGVALLGAPALVVLDEPTSALDPVGRADVRSIIRRARDSGSTVFLNSHLLTEVERVCDRVAIVDHGRVLASGRLDDLLGESTVRIRVTDLEATAVAALGRFGPVVSSDDGWLSIAGIDHDAIPDVVTAIVAAGGRVHAVDPGRATLEDRYMELVAGVARPRAPGPVDAGVRV
ncbi:MAG TPA: ABC transporter ATP-binding protein [Candidatus Limnocylindrales bacterium]